MKKNNKASLRNVARLAGVSPMAASLALKNKPGVGPDTRKRILSVARRLGYSPDARVESWMARVREAKWKDLLPIAWLNTSGDRDTFHRYLFQSPYLEGARERAHELGYEIDEIWCSEPGMTMKRLTKILDQRGVEGVVVTHPARHLRIEWGHLASVALGSSMLAPKLHRITGDFCFNLQLALKSLRRLGHRRIGICLGQELDSYSSFTMRATAAAFSTGETRAERVPPLFHAHFAFSRRAVSGDTKEERAREMIAWVKRYKPKVIVGHDNRLVRWLNEAGYRVPDDIGVVHLAVDDDVLDWAGIHSRRRETGAAAIDQLVAQMRSRTFGVPETPITISLRGTWQGGRTLAVLSRAKAIG
jgi:LacI family transcriptional regulator